MQSQTISTNKYIAQYFYYFFCIDLICKFPNQQLYYEAKMRLVDEMFKIERDGNLRNIDKRFWDVEHEIAEAITFNRHQETIAQGNIEFILQYRDAQTKEKDPIL